MSDPYVGEIKLFAGPFAQNGWALCNGQLLNISQNVTLFSILGTTYGGDGRSTFALPNFQGRVPIQQGSVDGLSNYQLGQLGGTPTITLLSGQMPAHNHGLVASTVAGTQTTAAGQMLSAAVVGGRTPVTTKFYSTASPGQALPVTELGFVGGSQPHNNMMPYLALNYVIALQGVFPPHT